MAQRSGDAGIAAFAQSIELALVQAYTSITATGRVTTPAGVDATSTFASHHEEHARALGTLAGDRATNAPNRQLVDRFRPRIERAADERALLEVARSLEDEIASTYLVALGSLEATEALRVSASILPVESQHAVVLATILNRGPEETFPTFETPDQALQPDEFPVS
jgi:IS5 family transposase